MIEATVSESVATGEELVAPTRRRPAPRLFGEIVAHLVRREIDSTHRLTVLGWAWPLVRQLAQLGILVLIFGSVIDLNIPHFPVYVFSGLVAWTWFATGVGTATTCLLDQRHLLFQPRFPGEVIPIVALAVPLVDVGLALPVLLVMVEAEQGLHWTALLLPLLVVLQFVLMSGIAWLTSAATVYFRDVPNLVAVLLQITFYLTPVFYRVSNVPSKYSSILKLNPMTTIVDGYRAVLLQQPSPGIARYAGLLAFSVVLSVAGLLVFRRKAPDYVDSL
jgi:lipopolysaccharide transport system permease protein